MNFLEKGCTLRLLLSWWNICSTVYVDSSNMTQRRTPDGCWMVMATIASATAAVATSRAMMTRISRQQLDELQAPADDVIESRDLSAADVVSYSGLLRCLHIPRTDSSANQRPANNEL